MSRVQILSNPNRFEFFTSNEAVPTLRAMLQFEQTTPFYVNDKVGEEAAEEAFDLTNNPSRQEEREKVYGYGRSVSVGDVVLVDDDGYLCMSSGWQKLNN